MPDIQYGRFGSPPRKKVTRYEKPRQEICRCLKYIVFGLNFAFLLVGVTCVSLGGYLCVKAFRPVSEPADILLNPAILLILVGLVISFVAAMGSIGALRDNICLLKSFALSTFFCYIVLVVCTFVLFILFYSDTTVGLSAHSVLLTAIKRYDQNPNLADFMDYIQEQLECCGATSASQGYKDWNLSVEYNCSSDNPYPERCGVPFSCCRRSHLADLSSSSGAAVDLLLPAMRSLECWQNALQKKLRDVETRIHTRGCLQPLKTVFESNAVHIGALVGGIILPVCFSVCLANVLAKQIDRQKYLLERESRRHERRKRRERHRFRDPFATVARSPPSAKAGNTPAIDMKTRNLPANDMQTRNLPAIDMKTRNLSAIDMKSRNLSAIDMKTRNLPAIDMKTRNLPAIDMKTKNLPAIDMKTRNLPAIDMKTRNLPAIDMKTRNLPAIDMKTRNPAIDMKTRNLAAIEMQTSAGPSGRTLTTVSSNGGTNATLTQSTSEPVFQTEVVDETVEPVAPVHRERKRRRQKRPMTEQVHQSKERQKSTERETRPRPRPNSASPVRVRRPMPVSDGRVKKRPVEDVRRQSIAVPNADRTDQTRNARTHNWVLQQATHNVNELT